MNGKTEHPHKNPGEFSPKNLNERVAVLKLELAKLKALVDTSVVNLDEDMDKVHLEHVRDSILKMSEIEVKKVLKEFFPEEVSKIEKEKEGIEHWQTMLAFFEILFSGNLEDLDIENPSLWKDKMEDKITGFKLVNPTFEEDLALLLSIHRAFHDSKIMNDSSQERLGETSLAAMQTAIRNLLEIVEIDTNIFLEDRKNYK